MIVFRKEVTTKELLKELIPSARVFAIKKAVYILTGYYGMIFDAAYDLVSRKTRSFLNKLRFRPELTKKLLPKKVKEILETYIEHEVENRLEPIAKQNIRYKKLIRKLVTLLIACIGLIILLLYLLAKTNKEKIKKFLSRLSRQGSLSKKFVKLSLQLAKIRPD